MVVREFIVKKNGLILIMIILLGTLLIGCSNAPLTRHFNSYHAISNKTELAIRQTYSNINNDIDINDVYIRRYFGTFDGISLIIISGDYHWNKVWSESIGGFEFYYPIWFPIIGYTNGKFYTLTELYDNGLISNDILRDVHEKFNL